MLWMMVAVTTLLAVAPAAPQSNATQNSGAMCNAPNEAALRSRSPTNDEINAAEVGNPESPDYNESRKHFSGGDWNAEWQAAEAGNPDSPDYKDRRAPPRSTTNDEINAAEVGNPESPDYKDRREPPRDENWRAEWQALEAGNPDGLDYKDRRDPARDENSRAKRDVLEAGNPHKAQAGDSPAKGGPC